MSGQRRVVPPARRGPATSSISRPACAATRLRKIGDGDLLRGADVIDAEMLALFAHHQHAGDEIVDEAEAAGLLPGALDLEAAACRSAVLAAGVCRRSANCGITCSQPMSGP